MSYMNCPSCGSQNRARDENCYNCSKPLSEKPTPRQATREESAAQPGAEVQSAGGSRLVAFVALCLTAVFGGALGYGIEFTELEMPFFLEELLLGIICATFTAFCLGKFLDMPDGLIFRRLGPAAGYGALVGICLFSIWWSFDPSAGFTVIGAIAGFCSGLPIIVSYGLAGGESRVLGTLEFLNVVGSLVFGLVAGVFLSFEEGEFYIVPGIMGMIGLIPTLLGGRINVMEMLEYLPSSRYDDDDW